MSSFCINNLAYHRIFASVPAPNHKPDDKHMQQLHNDSRFSLNIGPIHFVGIGGIGMSGIAEILHNLGYQVQGSDAAQSANTDRLEALGIKVKIGQREENVAGVSVVVRSSAVKDDNPEVKAAREAKTPVIQRAEMLAELMRFKNAVAIAGTHGKTTTTSMVAALFDAAGKEPTVVNGGILNAYNTNAKLGKGSWIVAEADESDGSFLKLPSTIGVITNIDPEHLDHYGSFDVLKECFYRFIYQLPFYGFAVLCADHEEVKKLAERVTDRKVITYGEAEDVDVRAKNVNITHEGTTLDVEISDYVKSEFRSLDGLYLPMPGKHNVLNALAAIAVAAELGFDKEAILSGFQGFQGVKRRFTVTGEVDNVLVIDDYAHHPTEINATLATAKEVAKSRKGHVIAVFQPHRYSRVHDLKEEFENCFTDADRVLVADVFAAGEQALQGINKEVLAEKITENGVSATPLASPEALPEEIFAIAQPGDVVVCMGAGSSTKWAYDLPNGLTLLKQKKAVG